MLQLLVVLTNHLAGSSASLPFLVSPDLILMVAAIALALGHWLAGSRDEGSPSAPMSGWTARYRQGGLALTEAAAGLFLLGIATVAARTLGLGGARPSLMVVPAFATLALTALFLWRRRANRRGKPALANLLVLGAAGLGLLTWFIGGSVRHASPFWTVWGGIVPALWLVVAGHIGERRGLFVWGLILSGGLTLGMLAVSGNLIAFSGNMLVCAFLLALTLVACRWADRRLIQRSA